MSRRPRDSQRSKIYNAERVLEGPTVPFDEARDTIASITEMEWFTKLYGMGWDITVKPGREGTRASSFGGRKGSITLPGWARQEHIICHELAHNVTHTLNNPALVAAHGWEFASNYLTIVENHMGKGYRKALQDSFKENRVRWKPKATRTLTPEQRAAATERLAQARRSRQVNKAGPIWRKVMAEGSWGGANDSREIDARITDEDGEALHTSFWNHTTTMKKHCRKLAEDLATERPGQEITVRYDGLVHDRWGLSHGVTEIHSCTVSVARTTERV